MRSTRIATTPTPHPSTTTPIWSASAPETQTTSILRTGKKHFVGLGQLWISVYLNSLEHMPFFHCTVPANIHSTVFTLGTVPGTYCSFCFFLS